MDNLDPQELIGIGQRVLNAEAEAIQGLHPRLNEDFVAACGHMYKCTGRVVVTGMGKSGHIAGKIAATLCPLPTPTANSACRARDTNAVNSPRVIVRRSRFSHRYTSTTSDAGPFRICSQWSNAVSGNQSAEIISCRPATIL